MPSFYSFSISRNQLAEQAREEKLGLKICIEEISEKNEPYYLVKALRDL